MSKKKKSTRMKGFGSHLVVRGFVGTPECVCVSSWRAGEVQAFHEDLNGRQHINEVYKLSVDKLYDILFTESQFMSDFMEQRGISGQHTS